MKWHPHPYVQSTITATGVRGRYTISRVGSSWWLEGVGHDDLSLWGMTSQLQFTMQEQARLEAERIDGAKVREPAVGGE